MSNILIIISKTCVQFLILYELCIYPKRRFHSMDLGYGLKNLRAGYLFIELEPKLSLIQIVVLIRIFS